MPLVILMCVSTTGAQGVQYSIEFLCVSINLGVLTSYLLFLDRPRGWESPLSPFLGLLVFETLDKPSGASRTVSGFPWPSGGGWWHNEWDLRGPSCLLSLDRFGALHSWGWTTGMPLWEGLAPGERDWDSSGLSRQRLGGS